MATAKAVAAGNSCRQEDVIATANLSRRAIADMLRACKEAAFHPEVAPDVRLRALHYGRECANGYLELLDHVLLVRRCRSSSPPKLLTPKPTHHLFPNSFSFPNLLSVGPHRSYSLGSSHLHLPLLLSPFPTWPALSTFSSHLITPCLSAGEWHTTLFTVWSVMHCVCLNRTRFLRAVLWSALGAGLGARAALFHR